MTKVEREVVFNSENGQKEMTGVRHSDDDVKKKVILVEHVFLYIFPCILQG